MTRRETLLRLKLEPSPPVATMEIPGARSRPLSIEFEDLDGIEEAWGRAGRALRSLVEKAPSRSAHATDIAQVMFTLHKAGHELGQRLTDGDNYAWNKLQQELTLHRATRWPSFAKDDLPIVEVVAHGHGFPVELIPLGPAGGEEPKHIDNDLQLLAFAERFLGFSALVSRFPPDREPSPAELDNDPTLPIQLFRYRSPPPVSTASPTPPPDGFRREETFLKGLAQLSVDGPYPSDADIEGEVADRVTAALFDAGTPLRAGVEATAVVAHFACHCTAGKHIEDFKLLLSTESGAGRPVTLGAIMGGYGTLGEGRPAADGLPPRAVVVLNACDSSAVDPLSSLGFQRWFLKNSHPAFLGTLAAIPDAMAADFAELLYRFLLGGCTLGASVVLARRELLLTAKSPLGMLYSLHGNEQLTVHTPHPDVLPTSAARGN